MIDLTIFSDLKTPSKNMEFSQVINEITSQVHNDKVMAIREAGAKGDLVLYNQLKKALPSFTYAATYKTARRLEYIDNFNNIVGIDLDHIGDEKAIIEISNSLREDKNVYAFFVSPSGDGLKLFFRIDKDQRVDDWIKEKQFDRLAVYYSNKFTKISDYVKKTYGVNPDPAVKDITRLCFFSSDKEAYYNPQAIPINIEDDELLSLYHEHIKVNPNVYGNRNNSLYAFTQKAIAQGIERNKLEPFCIEKYLDTDFELKEIKATLYSASKSEIANGKKKEKKEGEKVREKKTNEITNEELVDIFSRRFERRFNLARNCFEIFDKEKPKNGWKIFDEIISNTIHKHITDNLPSARRINIEKVLLTSDIKQFDPFVDKLNSLEAWDGEDHIEKFANTVKTKNRELWIKDLTKFLVAMIATLLNEKIINHYCLVLIGKEGIGKTSFIKKLILKGWEDYFSQNPLDIKHKDTTFKLSQNVLISIDELSKYTKKEIDNIKELITRDCMQERVHFGKNQQMFVRRASFCATLNDSQFLSGEEGERRFWTHEALEIDYTKEVEMEKVYAQALALYKDEYKYWETGEEIQKRREENSKYTRPNFAQELILQVFKIPTQDKDLLKFENPKFYTCAQITKELIEAFGSNHKDLIPEKVGKEITKMGLECKRSNGCKRYLLSKKDQFERNKEQEVDFDELATA